MRLQTVVVRDFMSRAKVLVVCDADEKVVFVTSKSAFERLKSGDENVMPIGFRIENVFADEGNKLTEPVDWKRLTPWRP